MQGIFELKSAADMVRKLRHEFRLLKKEPTNSYTAFNFFVTAEHIPDWLYFKEADQEKRQKIKKDSPLLMICSHIANGAKHFEVSDKRHRSVLSTEKEGGWFPTGYFHPNYWAKRYFKEARLVVNLRGDVEKIFGPSIDVIDLAEKILEFWENHEPIKKLGA